MNYYFVKIIKCILLKLIYSGELKRKIYGYKNYLNVKNNFQIQEKNFKIIINYRYKRLISK